MKTKWRTCWRCGKETDKPFHTCGPKINPPMKKKLYHKPDPIELGSELSTFLRDKTVLWQKNSLSWQDSPEVEALLRIIWERDFWRDRCLNP